MFCKSLFVINNCFIAFFLIWACFSSMIFLLKLLGLRNLRPVQVQFSIIEYHSHILQKPTELLYNAECVNPQSAVNACLVTPSLQR